VAPPTAQWAALEKNRGSDSRAVVYGKTFNIKHNTFHQIEISGRMENWKIGKMVRKRVVQNNQHSYNPLPK
jgi:hypothetical protein